MTTNEDLAIKIRKACTESVEDGLPKFAVEFTKDGLKFDICKIDSDYCTYVKRDEPRKAYVTDKDRRSICMYRIMKIDDDDDEKRAE